MAGRVPITLIKLGPSESLAALSPRTCSIIFAVYAEVVDSVPAEFVAGIVVPETVSVCTMISARLAQGVFLGTLRTTVTVTGP